MTEIDMMPWLESWYSQTGNPTYAWEAISRSVGSDMPIPEWALTYLKDASLKMATLGQGRDFRQDEAPRIDGDTAMKLVGQALGLSKERAKNAFERRQDDAQAAHFGLDDDWYGRRHTTEEMKSTRNIEDDRAARIIRRGRKLNRAL